MEVCELQSYKKLMEGFDRFKDGKFETEKKTVAWAQNFLEEQDPFCVVVACSDSRVPPEILFDAGIGDLFVLRTAGNLLGNYNIGSIEYAVEHLNIESIVIMGHEDCGAYKAIKAYDGRSTLSSFTNSLFSGMTPAFMEKGKQDVTADQAARKNLSLLMKELRCSSEITRKWLEEKEGRLWGRFYNMANCSMDIVAEA